MSQPSDLHKPYLVHHYVERAASRDPHRTAVCCGDKRLTYAELDSRSRALAHRLIGAGVKRGSCVPLLMPKSTDAILGMTGVSRAGGAYVPLDLDSPSHRIVSILQATQAQCVLVNHEGREKLASPEFSAAIHNAGLEGIHWIFVDAQQDTPDTGVIEGGVSVDIAYVLFTSGSTGTPKGVMIAHQAVTDYIDWCVHQYRVTPTDQVSNHAPLYFDNSTFDIYTAFAAGATLHLVPPHLNAVLPRLAGWIAEHAISVFFCVPSVLTLLLQSRRLKAGAFPALREVIFAGEVVQPDVLTQWMTLYPQARFTNMYGPTEITVDCTYHVVDAPPGTDPVPIGRARPNMELLVHTESGELVQTPGATGELWVRGLAVGYGYLGDEERTQKVFVQNPFTPFPDRLYRTGDLVTVREDGNFMFLGRADQQIKYLGHRIELGEIEAQLQALPEVEEAVVVFRQGESASEQGIGALVSVREGVKASDVLAALRHRVPSYMLPKRILCTQHSFPRTPNGKYDRKTILTTVFSGRGGAGD